MSEFNKLYPDIEVRLKGVDQDEGALSKDVDVAIYYGRGHWDNLVSRKVSRGRATGVSFSKIVGKTTALVGRRFT